MLRPKRRIQQHGISAAATSLFTSIIVAFGCQTAFALIRGGEGNKPVSDPGWPAGAAAIFNHPGRIAWWEGPPFGGGQWVAECRGDAKQLSSILADFAKLDAKTKRIVVHDGVGRSFWLNPNREAEKAEAAKIDWIFMVWQPANWEHLRTLPADLNPPDGKEPEQGPPVQIDVYAGGIIRWSDVKVPEGLKVVDQRLEAHGFTLADGTVLEGKVIDLATKRPVAAQMRLQRIEPQPKGGYNYTAVAKTASDALGRWVLKNAPAGWHRVVVEADGYVSRVIGYGQFDDQPQWTFYDGGLLRAAPVSGRVTDDAGKPLADVQVRFGDVTSEVGGRYESVDEYTFKTDAEGRFSADQIPAGKATIWLHKPGYCRPGLGQPITTPAKDIVLKMMKSARIVVTVDFTDTERPEGYIVHMEPEGGEAVGKWSGSGNIDAKNQITYEDVPPGRYVVHGQPNPSSADEHTDPVKVELHGGRTIEITLPAK